MSIGSKRENRRNGLAGPTDYATAEEFASLFESEREPLFRLAWLLTASSEKAEQSLSLALSDCRLNGSVSTDSIFSWARRAIVRNAIQLILCPELALPAQNPNGDGHYGNSQAISSAAIHRIDDLSILKMPDFVRLVFVITVLEHMSIQDCALLMGRSPKEVRNAQKRAIRNTHFAENILDVSFDDGATEQDVTCGKLFEN